MATKKTTTQNETPDIEIEEITGLPEEPKEPEESAATQMRKILAEGIKSVVVAGQAYKIGSRRLQRADLKVLKDLYDDFVAQEAAEEDNGPLLGNTYVAFFDRR